MNLDELKESVDLESLDETRGHRPPQLPDGRARNRRRSLAPFNYAAAARKRAHPARQGRRVRPRRRLRLPPPARHHPLDPARRDQAQLRRLKLLVATRPEVQERGRGAHRHRPQGPRLHRPHLRQRAEARRGVLLPLRHRGLEVARRPLPHRAAAEVEAAGPDRLLLLSALGGRLLQRPARDRERGRRPGGLPRATTSTSTPTTRAVRLDRTGNNKDGDTSSSASTGRSTTSTSGTPT